MHTFITWVANLYSGLDALTFAGAWAWAQSMLTSTNITTAASVLTMLASVATVVTLVVAIRALRADENNARAGFDEMRRNRKKDAELQADRDARDTLRLFHDLLSGIPDPRLYLIHDAEGEVSMEQLDDYAEALLPASNRLVQHARDNVLQNATAEGRNSERMCLAVRALAQYMRIFTPLTGNMASSPSAHPGIFTNERYEQVALMYYRSVVSARSDIAVMAAPNTDPTQATDRFMTETPATNDYSFLTAEATKYLRS